MRKYFLIILILLVTACSSKVQDTPKSNLNESNSNEEVPVKLELFEQYYTLAEDKMEDMTLEEKVGQMFLVRLNKKTITSEITKYSPGGYIFFAKDFTSETPASLKKKMDSYNALSKVPLIYATDEEGGTVNRVSYSTNFRKSPFLSNQELYKNGGFSLVLENEQEKINLLKTNGINLNLAPVADVSTNPKDYIYKRSFGADATLTSDYISKIVNLNNKEGLATTLKHFPGYGNNVDTHTGIAIDKRTKETFENNDFLPFKAGIESGVPAILVSHNVVLAYDENYPASLSVAIHNVLREDLEYSGLIITDDLAMDAITKYTNGTESATLAVLAGNDLIITSDFDHQYQAVLNALKSGALDEDIINLAVKRILAFKYAYGIIK